jgi:hypothetical protein
MTQIEAARKQAWWCELCERMHPIGEHDRGKSWPVQTGLIATDAQTTYRCWCGRPLLVQTGRCNRGHDLRDILYCSCGLHLFSTEKTVSPAAWARHVAHIRAFQQETQRLIDTARRKHTGHDPTTGPCAHCQKPCERYGPGGHPLCPACQAQQTQP